MAVTVSILSFCFAVYLANGQFSLALHGAITITLATPINDDEQFTKYLYLIKLICFYLHDKSC